MSETGPSVKFELTTEDMDFPISVGEGNTDRNAVLVLRKGTVVNAAFVRVLNDLLRAPDDDPLGLGG